jgi:hypothetical protein
MNEIVNARSDEPSNARDAGREDLHNAALNVSRMEQLGAHPTAMAAEHPPINAATSDLSRCPFFRALTAATSAFTARQASPTSAEIAPVEADSTAPRASDTALRAMSERA